MSRFRAWGIVLALSAGLPGISAGQTSSQYQATARKLERLHADAVRNRERAERLFRATFDTLRAGPVTMLVHPGAADAARNALETLVPLIESTYRDGAAALGVATAADPPITLWDPTLNDFRAWQEIRHQVQQRTKPPQGHPWYRWSGNALIAPFSQDELDDGLSRTYVTLVTAESPATTLCFEGSIAQCRVALELAPVPNPAEQWYTAARRRALAVQYLEDYPRTASSAWLRVCARGSDEGCIQAMRTGELTMTAPLGGPARVTLARYVLTNGDRSAFGRLTGPTLRMRDALERATGMPIDSVVARWRAAVLAARPVRLATTPATAWAAVVWTVVFGALALKGSRWRRI